MSVTATILYCVISFATAECGQILLQDEYTDIPSCKAIVAAVYQQKNYTPAQVGVSRKLLEIIDTPAEDVRAISMTMDCNPLSDANLGRDWTYYNIKKQGINLIEHPPTLVDFTTLHEKGLESTNNTRKFSA